MKLKIKVTKEILMRAANCVSLKTISSLVSRDEVVNLIKSNCAIALAVRELFPYATVCNSHITLRNESMYEAIKLPMEAQNFIRDFDDLEPEERILMDELEFGVDLTPKVLSFINIDEAREALKNSTTLELVS